MAAPTTKPLIQPNAQSQYEVTAEDLPLVLPDAADVPVELASARVPAGRGERLGEVPLLRRRVHAQALSGAVAQPAPRTVQSDQGLYGW